MTRQQVAVIQWVPPLIREDPPVMSGLIRSYLESTALREGLKLVGEPTWEFLAPATVDGMPIPQGATAEQYLSYGFIPVRAVCDAVTKEEEA